jgi:hypothetical protein
VAPKVTGWWERVVAVPIGELEFLTKLQRILNEALFVAT